jgi:uncharacterized protein with PIN domain
MLGRLCTWLRLIGEDCEYDNRWDDAELLYRRRATGRVVLSRDRALLRRLPPGGGVPIRSDRPLEQLAEVCATVGLPVRRDRLFTRCVRCNAPLGELCRLDAAAQVPPYIFSTQPAFRHCPLCDRIYWAGTHRASAVERLTEAGLL